MWNWQMRNTTMPQPLRGGIAIHVQICEREQYNVVLLGLYRQEMIEGKWNDLLASLETCKNTLSRYHDLMSVFSEMNDCLANMAQIEVS